MSDALALIAHDLKNALGGLESELAQLIDEPTPVMAQRAHIHCTELRRQFVQFLTLYSAREDGLRPLCEDEAPGDLAAAMSRMWNLKLQMDGSPVRVSVAHPELAPPFWHFDRRLVQLALDAAIHNATRFAQAEVQLSVREEAGWLCWEIEDDGDGLSASSDPGAAHATGLGTALAEAVASAHQMGARQGHTRLSPGHMRGACFSMRLP